MKRRDRLIVIDPGNQNSAVLGYDARENRPTEPRAILPNEEILALLRKTPGDVLVIETFRPRGQPLYSQLVETAIWIGRFVEAWGREHALVCREDVKLHVCGGGARGDPNVRAALIDRWGGKDAAVGTKAAPGPLYGIKADLWAALAVAVTHADGFVRPPPKKQRGKGKR